MASTKLSLSKSFLMLTNVKRKPAPSALLRAMRDFVLNSLISDEMSSVEKKKKIDLIVSDFKQIFDLEEVPIALNELYEAGIQNYIFALLFESNHENLITVKTPTGLTERKTILNQIMQGDVLGVK